MPKMLDKREALRNIERKRSVQVRVTEPSARAGDNTLTFVFVSNDNAGVRFDWGSGEYYNEILDVNGASVERLNTFFKNHTRSVDDAIGKVSNVRVDNGELVGDITFGTDEDSQKIYRKYLEGILTDVSIGYEIRDYKVESQPDGERDNVTITDFDVFEVSAVGIGFDSGAKKRSNEDSNLNLNKEITMDKERLAELQALQERTEAENKELKQLLADKEREKEAEAEKLRAENAKLQRDAQITALGSKYGITSDKVRAWLDDDKMTVENVRDSILDTLATQTEGFRTEDTTKVEEENLRQALRDGLALRLGRSKTDDMHPDAERYRNAPLAQIANMLLPENERSFNPSDIAERALKTGDFPALLLSAGNRVLEAEFEAQMATARMFVKEVDVPDFRTNTDIVKGQGGRLSRTLENGDLKELTMAEHSESWKLESFGNKFVLTREVIINDDLGAFNDMLSTFASMAVTTFNGLTYDLLRNAGDYANYKMADGSSVYSVEHGNLASDDLSAEALTAGRVAMRKQKSIDGVTPLNIAPRYLIVAPELEAQARELLYSTAKIDAPNAGVINTVQNMNLKLIVDAELQSPTEWYLVADRRTIKVGYLAGTNRRPVVKMGENSVSRTVFEGVFDIGFVVEDYRGLYQGNQ